MNLATSFQFSPYAIPLLLSAAAGLIFAWYALRRRQQPEALTFGLMMLALAWWSLCYSLVICATELQTQYLFNRLKYIGVMAVPPLWIILALQYTGRHSLLTRRNLILLFTPTVAFLLVVLTDSLTHLWWTDIWLGEFNDQPVLRNSHGPAYYVHTAISYLYVFIGLVLYIRLFLRSAPAYRSRALLMPVAAAIPLAANIVTQFGLSPLPWGLDAFFFTLGAGLMAVAIFRYRFLDLVPVARQAIVDQIPQGVIVTDATGQIVDANPAARSLVGAGKDTMIGSRLESVIGSAKLKQALLELVADNSGTARQRDVKLDGIEDPRTFSISTSPLAQSKDRPLGQIILMQDISERVAAQQQLEFLYQKAELERERLALTIETASDGIVLLDHAGTVLASNPSAQQLFPAQHSGQFPPELQAVLAESKASARLIQGEINVKDQNFHIAAAPVPGTGLVFTMHDVTHFRQLAGLKDDFVRTVSHDLRTPLTSIRAYAQLAMLSRTSEDKKQDALEHIEESATRMAKLISDLLDLATLEAGVKGQVHNVQLDQAARAAVKDLEGAACNKGLCIETQLDDSASIAADERLIAQVWRNLLDNAIKYTERGTITLSIESADGLVTGRVTDTGCGIAATDLPYVFDKFYRARSASCHQVSGTGLGLALVKSIVERYDGRVQVTSVPGAGSTFAFSLPPGTEP